METTTKELKKLIDYIIELAASMPPDKLEALIDYAETIIK